MPKSRTNTLLIGDTLYELTDAYRNGARACRAETPFWANPHRDGSQRHADWAAGHDNEAAGHHRVSVTLDVIEAAPAGIEFTAPEEEGLTDGPPAPPYRAFTTAHDEVIHAKDLLDPDPGRSADLRGILARVAPDNEAFWDEKDRETAREALDLLTKLPDLSGSGPVILLLDNSGSMRGRQIASLVGLTGQIGDALDQAGLRFEVLGFTTRSWKGGRSREQWIMEGRPREPGRLCDLRHLIYRGADEPWDPEPLGLMLTEGVLKENVDGEALLWAAERGRRLGGATIVHVTDGTPMDDSTLAANPADYLTRHMEMVTDQIRADPDLNLITARLTAGAGPTSDIGLGWISGVLVEATLRAIAASTPDPDRSVPEGP